MAAIRDAGSEAERNIFTTEKLEVIGQVQL